MLLSDMPSATGLQRAPSLAKCRQILCLLVGVKSYVCYFFFSRGVLTPYFPYRPLPAPFTAPSLI